MYTNDNITKHNVSRYIESKNKLYLNFGFKTRNKFVSKKNPLIFIDLIME